jgi:hypothetical protein
MGKAGSPKRYNNLFDITLDTGFGGGIVRDGELFVGDNSMAGEVRLLRHKLSPAMKEPTRLQAIWDFSLNGVLALRYCALPVQRWLILAEVRSSRFTASITKCTM